MPTFLEKKLADKKHTLLAWINNWKVRYTVADPFNHHGTDWTVDINDLMIQADFEQFAKDLEAHILEELAKGLPEEKRMDVGDYGIDSMDSKGIFWTQLKREGFNHCLAEVKKLFNQRV